MSDTVDLYSVLLQRYPATPTGLRLLAKLLLSENVSGGENREEN
jgi:hypothetical protein